MAYAKVEDGNVVSVGPIPKANAFNGNLRLLSDLELKEQFGYYTINHDLTPTLSYQSVSNVEYVYDAELDVVNEVKTIVDIDLDVYKSIKKNEIKNTLSEIRKEGFMTSLGFKIDCDDVNVNDFANAKQLLDTTNGTEITIRDFDNIRQTVTSAEFTTILVELGVYVQTQLAMKWTLQELIDSKLTHAEVSDIYWRKPVYDVDGITPIGWTYWGE